jgi:hypothetical protein
VLLTTPDAPVLMALDDTLCKKSSPRIPGVSMGRDPMSPAFHVNLCYGVRFVQGSILVTSKDEVGAARAVPVRFDFAPPANKPRPNHGKIGAQTQAESERQQQEWEAELEADKQEKKQRRLPLAGLNVIRSVRESLDQRLYLRHRILIR